MVFRLIYQSRNLLRRPNGSSELLKIIRSAERNNLALALTGALLFDKDRFIQVLEGESAKVTDLFIRISQDPRHEDVSLIDARAAEERRFTNWSMALIEGASAPEEDTSSERLLNFMCGQLAGSSGSIEVSVPTW